MNTTHGKLTPLVVVDGVRTPFVKAHGVFKTMPADELGRLAAKEVLTRTGVGFDEIDEVIFGCVGQPAKAANIARVIALRSGVDISTPALTVHRNCASGMESVIQAMIRAHARLGRIFLVGGTESMSDYPLLYSRDLIRWIEARKKADGVFGALAHRLAWRWRFLKPEVALIHGLTDPVYGINMGQTAENIAHDFAISRRLQDEYAYRSHRLAAAAREVLREETFDVVTPQGNLVRDDNTVRPETTLDSLAGLRPVFDRHSGSVTAGNSCPVSDGAAALLVMSEEAASDLGYEPLGRVLDFVNVGVDPTRMGLGPAFVIHQLLERNNLTLDDLEILEINEAFAAQILGVLAALESPEFNRRHFQREEAHGQVSDDVLNIHGGALALGHPVGASGTRLILTVMKELKRRGGGYGIATLCVGGGQGAGVLIHV